MSNVNLGDGLWGDFRMTTWGGLYSQEFVAGDPLTGSRVVPGSREAHIIDPLVRGVDVYDVPGQAGLRMEFASRGTIESMLVHVGSLIEFDTRHMHPTSLAPSAGLERTFTGHVFLEERNASPEDVAKTFTCYDPLSLLARTDNTMVFSGKRADEIIAEIVQGYGYNIAGPNNGTLANTEVVINRLVQQTGQSVWGLITDALEKTTAESGRRFIVRTTHGHMDQLELVEVGNTGVEWHVGDHLLTSYDFTDDAQDMRMEVNVITQTSDEDADGAAIEDTERGVVVSTVQDSTSHAAVRTFGMLRKTISPDGVDATAAQNTARAQQELDDLRVPQKRATTTSLLLPGIRRGDPVVIDAPRAGGTSRWYCNSVHSSWQPAGLTQTLELVLDAEDVTL